MKAYYDLHLHSCLSPCGDDDMTPGNIVGMAQLCGLNAIALTDHNTCGNCAPFLAHAEKAGLLALPGMELTTLEEVHVVCLFPSLHEAEAFSRYVYERLPGIPNDSAIFGRQVLRNEEDEEIGEEQKLLISAASIGIYEVSSLVSGFGGFAYPAHIDRASFSVLSNLGFWDDGMGFSMAEITASAKQEGLPAVPFVRNSDAHRLEAMQDAQNFIEIESFSSFSLIDALRKM